jgi:hypothetical protein
LLVATAAKQGAVAFISKILARKRSVLKDCRTTEALLLFRAVERDTIKARMK